MHLGSDGEAIGYSTLASSDPSKVIGPPVRVVRITRCASPRGERPDSMPVDGPANCATEVEGYFDDLAGEWHTRTSPQRTAVVMDALLRGLGAIDSPVGMARRGWQRHRHLFESARGTLCDGCGHRPFAGHVETGAGRARPSCTSRRRHAAGRRFIGSGNRADQRLLVSRRSRTRSVTRRRRWCGSTAAASKRRSISRSTILSRDCRASGRARRAGQVKVTGACFGERCIRPGDRRHGSLPHISASFTSPVAS